jgi:putative AdoMet-dependent methyltransferase
MTRSDDETRKLFDAWSVSYTEDVFKGIGPLLGYDDSLQIATSLVPVMSGQKVLDIGIGSAEFVGRLVEQEPSLVVSGIDPSERMLHLGRERFPDFDLKVGSFTQMPYADDTFDWVISSFAFHEVALNQRDLAFAEIRRVLKPSGRVALLDIMFVSEAATDAARQVIGRAWDDSEDYALVGTLDARLREQGLTPKQWHQTGSFHWLVLASA